MTNDPYMLSRRFLLSPDTRLPPLDPKAEEALLMLGDEFITRVLELSLMVAKGRGVSAPEPQDIEFAMEKLWGVQLARAEPVENLHPVPKPSALREKKDPAKKPKGK